MTDMRKAGQKQYEAMRIKCDGLETGAGNY